ncbi:MAG TPA: hypothetical protein V6C65_02695 [Allocoleopsis sp.]
MLFFAIHRVAASGSIDTKRFWQQAIAQQKSSLSRSQQLESFQALIEI